MGNMNDTTKGKAIHRGTRWKDEHGLIWEVVEVMDTFAILLNVEQPSISAHMPLPVLTQEGGEARWECVTPEPAKGQVWLTRRPVAKQERWTVEDVSYANAVVVTLTHPTVIDHHAEKGAPVSENVLQRSSITEQLLYLYFLYDDDQQQPVTEPAPLSSAAENTLSVGWEEDPHETHRKQLLNDPRIRALEEDLRDMFPNATPPTITVEQTTGTAALEEVVEQTEQSEHPCPVEGCTGKLIQGYGMAGGGMGSYDSCDTCDYFNKVQDPGADPNAQCCVVGLPIHTHVVDGLDPREVMTPSHQPESATADGDAPKVLCPDGGTCHHECMRERRGCFRVQCCEPLSGVYPDNQWPTEVKAQHGQREEQANAAATVLDELVDRSLATVDPKKLKRALADEVSRKGVEQRTAAIHHSRWCICDAHETAYADNPKGHRVDCPWWGTSHPNRMGQEVAAGQIWTRYDLTYPAPEYRIEAVDQVAGKVRLLEVVSNTLEPVPHVNIGEPTVLAIDELRRKWRLSGTKVATATPEEPPVRPGQRWKPLSQSRRHALGEHRVVGVHALTGIVTMEAIEQKKHKTLNLRFDDLRRYWQNIGFDAPEGKPAVEPEALKAATEMISLFGDKQMSDSEIALLIKDRPMQPTTVGFLALAFSTARSVPALREMAEHCLQLIESHEALRIMYESLKSTHPLLADAEMREPPKKTYAYSFDEEFFHDTGEDTAEGALAVAIDESSGDERTVMIAEMQTLPIEHAIKNAGERILDDLNDSEYAYDGWLDKAENDVRELDALLAVVAGKWLRAKGQGTVSEAVGKTETHEIPERPECAYCGTDMIEVYAGDENKCAGSPSGVHEEEYVDASEQSEPLPSTEPSGSTEE